MVVVGGGDTVVGDGEDLLHEMRGKALSGKSVKFEPSLNISPKFSKFGCSTCRMINTHTCDNSSVA